MCSAYCCVEQNNLAYLQFYQGSLRAPGLGSVRS